MYMAPKAKESYDKLVKGVSEVVNSKGWIEFLKVQSKFYNYSFNNAFLIAIQCPYASRVTGFNTWKKLGRNVKKGSKGIKILAPLRKKVKAQDAKGKETDKFVLYGFRSVNVFDISQTEGKELPEICKPLEGDPEEAKKLFDALKEIIEIPIAEEEIAGKANGYYDLLDDRIALEVKNSLLHKAKTLAHEYTHSMLDRKDIEVKQSRDEAEIAAESVAFIVSDHFGLDTSSYSFEYVAAWSGADPEKILKQGVIIQTTASKIINQVEEKLKKETDQVVA